MGNASCCEAEDSKEAVVAPRAAEQYTHAGMGMGEDDRSFGVAPPTRTAKQEPAGGTKRQSQVPPLSMPNSQAYRGRAGAVHIILDRSMEANIGLNLDALDEQTAFVDGILSGAVESWNRKNPGIATLTAHDRIIAVNGCFGETDRILREMRTASKWDIIVDRPVEVKLCVDCKKYPSLGLDLKYSPNGGTLLIAGIGAGAVNDWNSTTHGPKIVARDRIVEVNNVRGTARQLLDTATDVNELSLTVLHYSTNDNFKDQH